MNSQVGPAAPYYGDANIPDFGGNTLVAPFMYVNPSSLEIINPVSVYHTGDTRFLSGSDVHQSEFGGYLSPSANAYGLEAYMHICARTRAFWCKLQEQSESRPLSQPALRHTQTW